MTRKPYEYTSGGITPVYPSDDYVELLETQIKSLGAQVNPKMSQNQAKKFDQAKNRLDLLPVQSLLELGKVLTYGASKYDSWNWSKGMDWSRLQGAALRHFFAYMSGVDRDEESGCLHLAHAMCCIAFLLQYQVLGLGTDDRQDQMSEQPNALNLPEKI